MSQELCISRALFVPCKERSEMMYNVYDCVEAFFPLLNTEYHLILGRKGHAVSLWVGFDKKDCFHLMGLQYLKDRPQLGRDRGVIFDEIKEKKIKPEQIESSDLYYKIVERINMLPLLEMVFDSDYTIFKYNQKIHTFSMIQAEYLMKNYIKGRNIFVFLSENSNGKYFCRSFFPEGEKDYSKNQASWTLLCKKKINISTGEEKVLLNRMKK